MNISKRKKHDSHGKIDVMQDRSIQRKNHYKQHFGEIDVPIYHSTDDIDPHIDIYQFPPSDDRRYWTFITGGMSNLPQTLPDGQQHYTELLTYANEPQPWIPNILKKVAEFPMRNNTFFYWGQTLDYGTVTDTTPTLLTAFILLPPYFESDDLNILKFDGDPVHFLWCVPITERECAYAVEHGSEALFDLMAKVDLDIAINVSRESII